VGLEDLEVEEMELHPLHQLDQELQILEEEVVVLPLDQLILLVPVVLESL
jgi:hypothetical protein